MLHKSFEITDAKADGDTGTFEATVAVFGNVDSGGDRILPHAFDQTLAKWRTVGDPIPVIFNHEHDNAMAHVGYADPNDVQATPKGLRVKGTLDIGDNPVAKQVHKLMKRRQLKEFSFGYGVPQGGEKRAADGANELSQIDLLEVGPTLKGMNSQTELHAVKSALEEARDEKTLRKATDQLERDRQAQQLVKADADTEEAEDDALEAVLELLADFLNTEDDPDDVAAAKDIMARVQALIDSEDAEEDAAPDDTTDGKSEKELRRETDRLRRAKQAERLPAGTMDVDASLARAQEALVALEAFEPVEVKGVQDGLLKAAWTTAYVNTLPDSSFLYVEPGGSKDGDGKTTPRSLRHFPYKDADGAVDLPHLRNALARIPDSNLPQDVKDRLTARAQRLLENQKSAAASPGQESQGTRSADPLRKRSLEAVLDIQSDGMSRRKSPPVEEPPAPDGPSEAELRRRSRDHMLAILTGTE